MSDENYIARVDRPDWTRLECVTTDMCNESGDEPDERNCMLYRGAAGRSHEYSPPLLGYAWTLPGHMHHHHYCTHFHSVVSSPHNE